MKVMGINIGNQTDSFQKEADLLMENAQQKEEIEQLTQQLKTLGVQHENQVEQILRMQHQLDALLRIVYGKKSERFLATDAETSQLSLFQSEQEAEQAPEETATEIITYKRRKKAKKPANRQPLPAHLPRIDEVIEPDMDLTKMKRIGEEVTEILEVNPAQLWVRRIIRPKYVFVQPQEDEIKDGEPQEDEIKDGEPQEGEIRDDEPQEDEIKDDEPQEDEIRDGVVVAPMPERPINRIIAGVSMLALICVEKYVDHLPFYRQIQRYIRAGIQLKASTINGWFVQICFLLLPLYEALKKEVLACDYLQGDESTIKVQITQPKNSKNKKPPKGKTHTGQLWGYRNALKNIAFFEYRTSRKKEHPLLTLKDFKGHLQTDDYGGYDCFDKHPDYIAVKCWAHCRRKFNDALKENRPVASLFMLKIQQLYKIEEDLRNDRPPGQSQADFYAQRKKQRQALVTPILNDIKDLLDKYIDQTTPKRLTGKAIRYTLNNWKHLCIYAQEGKLEIDNNLIENLIRPIAIGRKNYLFAGSHAAAQRAAMMYSFFGVCKHHGVNPFIWLKDVLERIADHPVKKVAELLPHHWKKEQAKKTEAAEKAEAAKKIEIIKKAEGE